MSGNCSEDDKLLRLIQESGLFDPDDGDSSGSDWTPDMTAEDKRKRNIICQTKSTPACLQNEENLNLRHFYDDIETENSLLEVNEELIDDVE